MPIPETLKSYLSSWWKPTVLLFLMNLVFSFALFNVGMMGNANPTLLMSFSILASLISLALVLGILIAAIYQLKNKSIIKGCVSLAILGIIAFLFINIGLSDMRFMQESWKKTSISTGELITEVLDCNTVKLSNERTIRLIGVGCNGREAEGTKYLKTLLEQQGSMVQLEFGATSQYEGKHRLANASIVERNGNEYSEPKMNINKAMMDAGFKL